MRWQRLGLGLFNISMEKLRKKVPGFARVDGGASSLMSHGAGSSGLDPGPKDARVLDTPARGGEEDGPVLLSHLQPAGLRIRVSGCRKSKSQSENSLGF